MDGESVGYSRDARRAFEPLLIEMLTLYPALLRSGSPAVRQGYKRVAYLAHGWYMRCHRGVEAVVALDKAGYAEEAGPIRRSILEHSLALRWLAAEGDAILDTVARGHARNAQKRQAAVADAKWTSIDLDEIREVIDEINAEARNAANDNLAHYMQRLQRHGEIHELPGYLAETSRAHPSYESAVSYIELPDGNPLPSSRQSVWPVPFAATEMLRALFAVRKIFDPEPWEDVLDRVHVSYCTTIDRVREQDGLPPIDWDSAGPKLT